MPSGLLYGLGAALAWWLTDIAAALSGRRLGSLRTLAGAQLVALAVLWTLVVVRDVRPFEIPTATVAFCLVLGALSMVSYLAFFTALRIGPVAVVSPVVAAFGGFTVVLAVIFRGESLTVVQAIGAVVATAGIVLTGVVVDGGLRGVRLRGAGVALALVAMALFAVLTVATAGPIQEVGWLPVVPSHGSEHRARLGAAGVRARHTPERSPHRSSARDGAGSTGARLAVVVPAGLLDVLGLISFAIGLRGRRDLARRLSSSFGPVVAVLVAVAFLHERLRPIQWLGLALLGWAPG
jgi:transporter family protein